MPSVNSSNMNHSVYSVWMHAPVINTDDAQLAKITSTIPNWSINCNRWLFFCCCCRAADAASVAIDVVAIFNPSAQSSERWFVGNTRKICKFLFRDNRSRSSAHNANARLNNIEWYKSKDHQEWYKILYQSKFNKLESMQSSKLIE